VALAGVGDRDRLLDQRLVRQERARKELRTMAGMENAPAASVVVASRPFSLFQAQSNSRSMAAPATGLPSCRTVPRTAENNTIFPIACPSEQAPRPNVTMRANNALRQR
jgi:hypothetical protein